MATTCPLSLLQDLNTPIHLAAADGHLEVVRVFISHTTSTAVNLRNVVGVSQHIVILTATTAILHYMVYTTDFSVSVMHSTALAFIFFA